ncbi:MAG: GntR family transcriptional regulator [Streptococcaceae bacterium]|jgi:DNA-binding GntR family transcriptional regulator|nr:GntR family transcriptional regulator [Streptococcaceae bacterium]
MKRKTVLYLDIANQIKEEIFSGKYPIGTLLPSETEFERMFDVSKITIRKAIELLASDEYVEKKSGKGTTVINNRPYNKLSKAASFTEILRNSTFEVTKKNLQFELIHLEQEHFLYSAFGDTSLLYSRMYFLDNKPYIFIKHYLPKELFEFGEDNLSESSIYRLLNEKRYYIASFKDEFSAATMDEEEQRLLESTSNNMLKRSRKSLDEKGRIVEYSQAIYNTNIHPYQIEYET